MKITPLDIRHKEFRRGLRGYVDAEVDEFLDQVAEEYERLFKENIDLTERVEALEEKVTGYRRIEDALQKTLVSAQASAEEVRQNAAKAAQLVLHEAELKARQLMNASYTERQAVEQATAKLRSAEQEFRFKFRQMLQSYLKQAEESTPPRAEPEPGISDTQANLARHADAIREAIAREEQSSPAGASPATPSAIPSPAERPGPVTTGPATSPATSAAVPELPGPEADVPSSEAASAVAEPPAAELGEAVEQEAAPAQGNRILFGERDDLLADVDGEVSENEFKW
jgi:cell division initiation protein